MRRLSKHYAQPQRIVVVTRASPFPCQRNALATALFISLLASAQATLAQNAAEIDWVEWTELTHAQRAQIPDGCCGLYVEPPLAPTGQDPDVLNIDGNASSTNADGFTQVAGALKIQQGSNRIAANKGVYDQNKQLFTLEDNIILRQQGLLMTGSKATYSRATEISDLAEASYLLHEGGVHGTASNIRYVDAEKIVIVTDGTFTRCEPGEEAWEIHGDSILLDRKTGMGTARDMTLSVHDIPVLYLPWIQFPIGDQRASGFLAPIIGSTRKGGIDVAAPYYLNLAPNYDLTLTPRFQSERGAMLGVEGRYLGNNFGQTLNVEYLPDDNRYNPATVFVPGSYSPPTPNRWLANYDLLANLGSGWSASVNYRAVSDQDYFQDFNKDGLNDTVLSFLYRSASLNWRDTHWSFAAISENIQIIDPTVRPIHEPYRTVPRLKLDGFYWLPTGLEYGVSAEYTLFDRDIDRRFVSNTDIDNGALVTGTRLSITPEISLPLGNTYSFFTPTLKYKYATYNLSDQARNTDASPSRGVLSANIDTGLIFERDTTIGGQHFLQTLEPRLYYLYNQYKNQNDIPLFDTSELTFSFNQLFRDDRFSGKDRVGDANQVTAAVSTRLYDDNGLEKAALSLGRIEYFSDRRVTLAGTPGTAQLIAHSALTGEFGYRLAQRWRMNSYLEWNTATSAVDVGSAHIQYQQDANHLINLGWRFRELPGPRYFNGIDRRISQGDVSAVWPLADNWNVIGSWNYDYSNKRTLEGIAGVEYTNCCWRFRFIGRSWIDNHALFFGREDNNTGVFVQFELKGLGSLLGGNVSGILNNGISGFMDRDNVHK